MRRESQSRSRQGRHMMHGKEDVVRTDHLWLHGWKRPHKRGEKAGEVGITVLSSPRRVGVSTGLLFPAVDAVL